MFCLSFSLPRSIFHVHSLPSLEIKEDKNMQLHKRSSIREAFREFYFCWDRDMKVVIFKGIQDSGVCVLVAHSCPALCNPMDCSPPGSSVHGILQARILRWVAISFSRGSSQPRDRTQVSCIAGRYFTIWATMEAQDTGEVMIK